MSQKLRGTCPGWVVVFKCNRKERVVRMPGGLSEAEARRCAWLKVTAAGAVLVRSYREGTDAPLFA